MEKKYGDDITNTFVGKPEKSQHNNESNSTPNNDSLN